MSHRFLSTFCSLTAAFLTLLQLPQICCGQCCEVEPEVVSCPTCSHCVADTPSEPCHPLSTCCCAEPPIDVVPPAIFVWTVHVGIVAPLPQLNRLPVTGSIMEFPTSGEEHGRRQARLNVWLI